MRAGLPPIRPGTRTDSLDLSAAPTARFSRPRWELENPPRYAYQMERQDRGDEQPQRHDSAEIAERLDRLTAEQADEVIRRAIRIQDDSTEPDVGTFDVETLRAAAAELGIPRQHLDRAIAEQRAGLLDPSPRAGTFDQLLGVTDLDQTTVVAGSKMEVERTVTTWLSRHEGMRVVRRSSDGATWEKDTRPLTSIRMGLGLTEGSKALREVGTVEHSVHSLDASEQFVSIKADPEKLRTVGGVLMALAAAVALTGGAAVAAGTGSILAGIATALLTGAALGGAVVGGIRSWAGRIRRAAERAIDAVRRPSVSRRSEPVPGWLGTVLRSLGLTTGTGSRDQP